MLIVAKVVQGSSHDVVGAVEILVLQGGQISDNNNFYIQLTRNLRKELNIKLYKGIMLEKYTKEYFEGKVLVARRQEQINKIKEDLEATVELKPLTFPVIIYQGLYSSIDVSEITEENLLKLKCDKEFSRRIIELR